MENARELVAQMDWLLQRRTPSVLSLEEAIECAERIRRLEELLEQLTQDQTKLN